METSSGMPAVHDVERDAVTRWTEVGMQLRLPGVHRLLPHVGLRVDRELGDVHVPDVVGRGTASTTCRGRRRGVGRRAGPPPRWEPRVRPTGPGRGGRSFVASWWMRVSAGDGVGLEGADRGSVGGLAGGHLLGRDLPRLGEQRVHELVLGDLRHDLALADDESQPVARTRSRRRPHALRRARSPRIP